MVSTAPYIITLNFHKREECFVQATVSTAPYIITFYCSQKEGVLSTNYIFYSSLIYFTQKGGVHAKATAPTAP